MDLFYQTNKQRWELCTFHDCSRILYAVLDDISSLLGNIEECLIVMKDKEIYLKHLAQNKHSENINCFCFPSSLFSGPWLPSHISFGCHGFVCLFFFFFFSLKLSYITHSASLSFTPKITLRWTIFLYIFWFLLLSEKIWSLPFYFSPEIH